MDSPYIDIANWFNRYYHEQVARDGVNTTLMTLKHKHSINVAAHTLAIAREEGWSAGHCQLAEVLGLLHDVGRFPQLVTYGTFSDTCSINHGAFGAEIVDSQNVLSFVDELSATILLEGIRYHNARTIPPTIAPQSRPFLEAVRDGDKLDIFRVINDAVVNNRIENHPEITLNIDIHGPINPAALSELKCRENVSYTNVRSLADFGLTQLSWLYDLHYAYSFSYILNHNIISDIIKIIPDQNSIKQIVDEIERFVTACTSRTRTDIASEHDHP